MLQNDLTFHSDSNWQWLCLEKIAKDYCNDIQHVISWVLIKYTLKTKQDLFEAIVNYILNEE